MPVTDSVVDGLAGVLRELARRFGFPGPASAEQRIAFDRQAASELRGRVLVSPVEASNRDIWSFLALVPLQDITRWRFGTGNRERWIGSDLTRHTWARLWWQATVFEGDMTLLAELSESDLNQILERRSIGGDFRLAKALGRAIVEARGDVPGRALVRDASARLRRYLAFIEVGVLHDAEILSFCRQVVSESVLSTAGGDLEGAADTVST
jgi:hypothetical protein